MLLTRSCWLARALSLGSVAVLLALSPARGEDQAPLNDPAAYCKAVGTIDAPDAKYKGPPVPDWMVAKAYPPEAIKAQKDAGMDPAKSIVWRCAAGAVLICVQGNSPQCGKASTSRAPTSAMQDFCKATPNAEVIPLSVIGHENPMIFEWVCRGKQASIKRQIFKVDAQGFPAELWQQVSH
jgi:hypothetical protein